MKRRWAIIGGLGLVTVGATFGPYLVSLATTPADELAFYEELKARAHALTYTDPPSVDVTAGILSYYQYTGDIADLVRRVLADDYVIDAGEEAARALATSGESPSGEWEIGLRRALPTLGIIYGSAGYVWVDIRSAPDGIVIVASATKHSGNYI